MKKMKNIKFLFKTVFITLTILLMGCEEENYEFGDLVTPSNLMISAEIVGADTDNPNGDGSGVVNFTATADNVISFKYVFEGESEIAPTGKKTFNFGNTGLHSYTVTVVALGTGGSGSSKSVEVEVLALYEPPADLIEMLTGGSARTWRIKAESPGHMGVGPADEISPVWWGAAPYEKDFTGMYDDEYVFNIDNSILHSTKGTIFGQAELLEADFGEISTDPNDGGEHEHYPLEDFTESWSISAPGGEETINYTGNGFNGFYVGGSHSYTILSRTADEMVLRTVGTDGNGWFYILTAAPSETDPKYTNLIWQDEFDAAGAPLDNNWGYDIGTGNNGWGNGESQYYTDRADNVTVADGVLKIIAKKESHEGSEYTAARLKTEGKFDFTYGRVDVKAKLPSGGGTWPAIWMLGSNFSTVGWPACGEIDIMEHKGNEPGNIGAAIHTTSSSGSTVNTGNVDVSDPMTEFHVYSVIWSENQITFLVDDESFYTYRPASKDQSTWPFDASQFLILNIAMGGTLGGEIDPGFTESTMEIDYVRVYQ